MRPGSGTALEAPRSLRGREKADGAVLLPPAPDGPGLRTGPGTPLRPVRVNESGVPGSGRGGRPVGAWDTPDLRGRGAVPSPAVKPRAARIPAAGELPPAFRHRILPVLLVLPQTAVLFVFFLYPAAVALLQSLFVQDAFGLSQEFAGLENFARVLGNPDWYGSLVTTLVFAATVTGLGILLALAIAWPLVQLRKGQQWYRRILVLPYGIAPAVSGVLWLFLFNPAAGLLPAFLRTLGIPWNHLLDPDHAMILVVAASVWKQVPYNLLFLLMGLASIPPSLLEAASVDGAGSFLRLRKVVLPCLASTLSYLVTMGMAFAFFDSFAIIHQTTHGGPGTSTTTLAYQLWKDGFQGMDQGGSAAQSLLLIAVAGILAWFQFRKGNDQGAWL